MKLYKNKTKGDHKDKDYDYQIGSQCPGLIYMPKECADQLLADIKSVKVDFLGGK